MQLCLTTSERSYTVFESDGVTFLARASPPTSPVYKLSVFILFWTILEIEDNTHQRDKATVREQVVI